MSNVLSNRQRQVPFTEQDESILRLGIYAQNQPLRVGMEVRAAGRQAHRRGAAASGQCSSVVCEDWISDRDEVRLVHPEAVHPAVLAETIKTGLLWFPYLAWSVH